MGLVMRLAQILTLLIAVLLSNTIVAQTSDGNSKVFRNERWGMSRSEVLKLEGTPVEMDKDSLTYRDTIAGLDVVVLYTFLEVVRKMGNSAAAEAQHTDMIQQQMADRYFSDHF